MKTILFLLLLCNNVSAQTKPFVFSAGGITNTFFSAELNAGIRKANTAAVFGFTTIPENSQPVLFQAKAGYIINEQWFLYAGCEKVMYSTVQKKSNYNSFVVGVQFHNFHFDRGTIYYHAQYSPGFVSAGIGMSFNMMEK